MKSFIERMIESALSEHTPSKPSPARKEWLEGRKEAALEKFNAAYGIEMTRKEAKSLAKLWTENNTK